VDKEGREDPVIVGLSDLLRRPLAMRVSYTKLDTYRVCPKRFKFVYVERATEAPTEKLLVGHAVHAALETWVAEKGEDLGDLMDIFTACLAKDRQDGEISDEEEQLARDMLIDYYTELEKIDRGLIVGVEHPFELLIDNMVITGVLDRVEYEDESRETLFVRDYKTGRYSISQGQAKKNLQMGIYTLAARETWPAAHYITELVYPRLQKSVKHEFTESELDTLRAEARDITEKIRFDDRYKPTGTMYTCANCAFVMLCGWGRKQKQIADKVTAKRERAKAG
jgi:CRISPR/Cas system-associated exonuclease Cas4 (RecB family)